MQILITVLIFVAALMGSFTGWQAAHFEISTECQRHGSFYVGQKNFECRLDSANQEGK